MGIFRRRKRRKKKRKRKKRKPRKNKRKTPQKPWKTKPHQNQTPTRKLMKTKKWWYRTDMQILINTLKGIAIILIFVYFTYSGSVDFLLGDWATKKPEGEVN